MGTHPIFESDFDCLTEPDKNLISADTSELNYKANGCSSQLGR